MSDNYPRKTIRSGEGNGELVEVDVGYVDWTGTVVSEHLVWIDGVWTSFGCKTAAEALED